MSERGGAVTTPARERPRPPALRRIWERMSAIYLHRWTRAMGEAPQDDSGALTLAGDSWSRALAGLTDQQLGAGLDACLARSDTWPPSLPEFRALCLQVPDLDDTRMAISHSGPTSPHAFYRLVWQLLDVQTFKAGRHWESEKALNAAYAAARKQVLRDLRFPDVPAGALPPPAPKPTEFDFVPPPAPTSAAEEIARLREAVLRDPDPEESTDAE